jgi:hypothetical protein
VNWYLWRIFQNTSCEVRIWSFLSLHVTVTVARCWLHSVHSLPGSHPLLLNVGYTDTDIFFILRVGFMQRQHGGFLADSDCTTVLHCKINLVSERLKKWKYVQLKKQGNKEMENFLDCSIIFTNLLDSLWWIVPESLSLLMKFVVFRYVFDQLEWKEKRLCYTL